MKPATLRVALLATTSAAALFIGGQKPVEAAPCAFDNQSPPINNTAPNNCISFNNGAVFTGNVTNSSTLAAAHVAPVNPGSSTGISILNGSALIGSVTNNGVITGRNGFQVNNSAVNGSSTTNRSTRQTLGSS